MKHVLITRPEKPALELAGMLAEQGLQAIVMPLYRFNQCQPDLDISEVFSQVSGRKLAVFTSPRAVQYGYECIPQELVSGLEFVAVGPTTNGQLQEMDQQVHIQPASGFTSEDLLGMTTLSEDPGTAVIFCAPGGREKLADGLRDLGWAVSRAMVYERQGRKPGQTEVDSLLAAENLLSVWTSISAFELAREYLPYDAWNKILHAPALVISSRIKHHLQQAGAKQVELAACPGNSGLLQSIIGS
jgi:uroporphyrinogen-III synthase